MMVTDFKTFSAKQVDILRSAQPIERSSAAPIRKAMTNVGTGQRQLDEIKEAPVVWFGDDIKGPFLSWEYLAGQVTDPSLNQLVVTTGGLRGEEKWASNPDEDERGLLTLCQTAYPVTDQTKQVCLYLVVPWITDFNLDRARYVALVHPIAVAVRDKETLQHMPDILGTEVSFIQENMTSKMNSANVQVTVCNDCNGCTVKERQLGSDPRASIQIFMQALLAQTQTKSAGV